MGGQESTQEIEKDILFGHEDIQHSTTTVRPVSGQESSEQDEIYGVKTINWENPSWKYSSLIGDERIINLQRPKVYVFSDSVLVSW